MAENKTQLEKIKKSDHPSRNQNALCRAPEPEAPRPAGGCRRRAPGESERGQGAGVAPTSARAWARYPQPRSSRQAQVLIASRGAGGEAGRRGRGAGAPAGLLWRRNSVPSLRERGPEEGGAESREPAERARREQRVRRGRQRQRGGGAGSARSPRPPRREPPGPPGRGWGRKGRRAGAGPLPWCVPGAGRCRARSPALALGATRPVILHICGRQPREGPRSEAGAAAAAPPITCLDARPGPGRGLALSLRAAGGPARPPPAPRSPPASSRSRRPAGHGAAQHGAARRPACAPPRRALGSGAALRPPPAGAGQRPRPRRLAAAARLGPRRAGLRAGAGPKRSSRRGEE